MFININSNGTDLIKIKDKDDKIIEFNCSYINPNPSAYDLILGDGMSDMTINSGVS